jgi:Methyltransferase domain
MLRSLQPGVVMDVGAKQARYRSLVPATEYLTLDLRADVGADIVGDLHDVPRGNASLDTVIATEVLEHSHDPARVVAEIQRILRLGRSGSMSQALCTRFSSGMISTSEKSRNR